MTQAVHLFFEPLAGQGPPGQWKVAMYFKVQIFNVSTLSLFMSFFNRND